jgi:uncharacterized protein YgbK (DUF1537 family)
VLGVVADDLTGAGDASVQFAKRGWETFLSLVQSVRIKPDTTTGTTDGPPSDSVASGSGRTAIAVTTDCRALDNETARQRTADAVTSLLELGIDRLFLKIDSTMRGSVNGQVGGALDAWRLRHPDARVVLCPAYPRMGRTVESKQLLVKGEPVHSTAIGRDPVTPVMTSNMTVLVPKSAYVTVPDAATDDDLMAIAVSIAAAGPAVIPVGSGGLAEALAEVWSSDHAPRQDHPFPLRGKNSRILLQLSSLNPVSHAQVQRLQNAFPDVVILFPPEERGDSETVAAELARRSADLIAHERFDAIGLVGGDGARATLRELRASGIRIVDSLLEGIPIGVITGGAADGMPVFTKAGGFGGEDALVRCVERIRA